jgi:hypothetical protein
MRLYRCSGLITTQRFIYNNLQLVAKSAFSDLRLVAKDLYRPIKIVVVSVAAKVFSDRLTILIMYILRPIVGCCTIHLATNCGLLYYPFSN